MHLPIPLAAVVFTVWSGLVYWPTTITCDVVDDATGDALSLRFERAPYEDVYIAQTVEGNWTITKTSAGWSMRDDTDSLLRTGIDDTFWTATSFDVTLASGAGRVVLESHHTDWTRIDVLWVPTFMWFLTGMALDTTLMILTWPIRASSQFLARQVPKF